MPLATLSTKGQIVLPKEVREALGLEEGDRFRITIRDGELVLARVPRSDGQEWRRWRGSLAGSRALEEHMAEHAEEIQRERLP